MSVNERAPFESGAGNSVSVNFERLLPLEGGSNFRDLGGYRAGDGRTVKRGMIYRSGAMTGLTEKDQNFLMELGIKTVVDFRSREEVELFPNHWADNHGLDFFAHDYSMIEISARMSPGTGGRVTVDILYQNFPNMLQPQLCLLFSHLLSGRTPLVFNCSAGQDRTGVASALILTALGVDWHTVIEDYHLSTEYRRPEIEMGGVDLRAHEETNDFAKLILRYGGGSGDHKPMPLLTEDNEPYLDIAFTTIRSEYGSVFSYLDEVLGVDDQAVDRLRDIYLSD